MMEAWNVGMAAYWCGAVVLLLGLGGLLGIVCRPPVPVDMPSKMRQRCTVPVATGSHGDVRLTLLRKGEENYVWLWDADRPEPFWASVQRMVDDPDLALTATDRQRLAEALELHGGPEVPA
jgi:hypothetical protein